MRKVTENQLLLFISDVIFSNDYCDLKTWKKLTLEEIHSLALSYHETVEKNG